MIEASPRRVVDTGAARFGYHECGPTDGPVLVLLHGLASDSDTWDRVIGPLGAAGVRVLALDLPGHGVSSSQDGYGLSEFVAALLTFLNAVDVDVAVLGGHSLGGAIAMEFAHTHPERVAGMVLVSAGGLGREVHLALRAAALPGAQRVFGLAMRPRMQRVYRHPSVHRMLGLTGDNLTNLRRTSRALGTAEGRAVFFYALRAVISPSGQRGDFITRQMLAPEVPTLVIWSEQDPVIPLTHARSAHEHVRRSQLLVLPGGGHEPHRRHVEQFVDAVVAFIAETGDPPPT